VEIEQAERRIREQNALQLLASELGASPEEAVAAPRPEIDEDVDLTALRDRLERELASLGPVNPLAREELLELSARNEFLEAQLEDVRGARRELNQVIRVIDAEIVDVFSRAFADVAHHYEALISSLFPGGSGQLILTAPDDPLSTGVEIEARPAGRNVRRLSLLSGGERSLVAIAFLFAVFRSRPSPFYLMDEVEAALDEPNLLRFLNLVDEFRNEAQLIIVSHQKKTMERGDAIYGVTLQPGGASRVVSQRVRNVVNPTLLALTPTDPSPQTSRSSVDVDPVDGPPVDGPPADRDTDAVEH
jgi:chromosome segregation protein